MKRIISLVLVLLMALPFAAFGAIADEPDAAVTDAPDAAVPEKLEIPAEPETVSGLTTYIYYGSTAASGIASSDSNSGLSADQALKSFGTLLKNYEYVGGTIVIPGKGYIGIDFTFPKNEQPVTITANDKKNGVDYREGITALEVAPAVEGGAYTNGTQRGMFMIYASKIFSIAGDYIFDEIDLIERNDTGTSKISVVDGGKLVIKNTCNIFKMTDAPESIILNVNDGGYAYIHVAGFEKFTGNGTIVMDKAIYEAEALVEGKFAEFSGAVVDIDGTVLRAATYVPEPEDTDPVDTDPVDTDSVTTNKPSSNTSKPATTTKTETTTNAPATTKAPAADDAGINPIIFIVAGVAVVAVVVVVVIVVSKKKKAQ